AEPQACLPSATPVVTPAHASPLYLAERTQIYKESWPQIDLVILDMIMPGVGGRDCFRAMRLVNPNVRALLSTGYGLNGAAQRILDEGVAGFVEKPYDLIRLSQAVAAVLGRGS
ncbi:MAG: response regulator, partial [Planctomycetes bacterium]|nr:response regulator [Planctomycetota bacterium]